MEDQLLNNKEIAELRQSLQNIEREKQKIIVELNEKIKYVNNLILKINYTNKTLLIGNKGAGKSTFYG